MRCYKYKKIILYFCIVFVCRAMCGNAANDEQKILTKAIQMAPVQYYTGCSGLFVHFFAYSQVFSPDYDSKMHRIMDNAHV